MVVGVLQHQADASPPIREFSTSIAGRRAVKQHLARGGPQCAVQVQEQGGLAGAVGTEDGQPSTAFNPKIEPQQRGKATWISIGQSMSFEQNHDR